MKYLTIPPALSSLGTGLWAAYNGSKRAAPKLTEDFHASAWGPGTIERPMSAKPPTSREAIDAEIDEMNKAGMVLEAAFIAGKLNKKAAIWTAVSVALSGSANFVGALR